MRKKIFLVIEYKDQGEYNLIRSGIFQLCRQQGVKINVYRELGANRHMKAEKLFYFKTKGSHKVVQYSEIIYIKKAERRVQINTINGCHFFYAKIDDIITALDMNEFITPHRSFIINKNKILEADKYNVLLKGSEEKIPISKRYRKFVIKAMKEIKTKTSQEIPEEKK